MTHDELLEKIDGETEFLVQHFALRAVLELHKPYGTTPPWGYVRYMACSACEVWTTDGPYSVDYPCPTIQAIEKELG